MNMMPKAFSAVVSPRPTLEADDNLLRIPAGLKSRGRARLAPWQIAIATGMMAAQMDHALSLGEVARALEMSLGHFIKAFANSVGDSPYQWFQKQRIVHSLDLLGDEKMSLAEVSATCGFSDQSHFTRCFMRATGTTPGAWRRKATS